MNELEEIQENVRNLVKKIREYSLSQAELWQQIPWWANQADGKSGWSDNLYRAIHYGYLAISSPVYTGGSYWGFIDLETGKIVSDTQSNHECSDSYLILLGLNLKELTAQNWLDYLKKKAKEPYSTYYGPADQFKTEKIKLDNIKKYGLSPNSYNRKLER